MTKSILVGSHVSAAGGLEKAILRAESIGCTVFQLFTKSNRQWHEKAITSEQAALFRKTAAASSIQEIVVHAAYLINLGSSKDDVVAKSINALTDEINRCHDLGIRLLVLHPGSHLGAGVDQCIEKIAANLDIALEKSKGGVTVCLETMAGQGSNVGFTFEQLAQMRALSKHKKSVGFCLDTCHIFCAGFDISTELGLKNVIQHFDDVVGLDHLKVIHVNDSMTELGSNKDRHAPLGEGKIPLHVFRELMNNPALKNIPKVLETPSDEEMKLWAKEIALLKSFVTP